MLLALIITENVPWDIKKVFKLRNWLLKTFYATKTERITSQKNFEITYCKNNYAFYIFIINLKIALRCKNVFKNKIWKAL